MSLHKPSPPAAVCRPLFALLCPARPHHDSIQHARQTRSLHQRTGRAAASAPRLSPQQMDNFFITALVRASACRKHAKHTAAWQGPAPGISLHHRPRRKRPLGVQESARAFCYGVQLKDASASAQAAPAREPTREEYRRLIDVYRANDGHLETLKEEDERMAREAREAREAEDAANGAPGPGSDGKKKRLHKPWPNTDELESEAIGDLEELLEHKGVDPNAAYEIYTSLSYPRAAYLSYKTIRDLLNCFAVVEYPTEVSMLRYLSVIDDMKACNMPVALADWNTAINFAGKCFRNVTNAEMETALYIWREMEQQAGVSGNAVTFNILFDIATKAGKFKLADMIKQEMESRKLKFDRFFRTNLIMWNGLQGDGDGVRKAYTELVDAGQIVDTVVMNCVLTALIKAGEVTAAEQVFGRMKRLHSGRSSQKQAPQNWRQMRELGILLNRAAAQLRDDPEARRKIQNESPVGPDYGTFKILIEHHAITSGNIDRVTELLDEMVRVFSIRLQGDMFYPLFFGFHLHGGVRYSSWTKARLESTWRAFVLSLEQGVADFRLDRTIATAAILAFAKCTSRDRTMEVWEEIRGKWRPSEIDQERIHERMARLFRAHPL